MSRGWFWIALCGAAVGCQQDLSQPKVHYEDSPVAIGTWADDASRPGAAGAAGSADSPNSPSGAGSAEDIGSVTPADSGAAAAGADSGGTSGGPTLPGSSVGDAAGQPSGSASGSSATDSTASDSSTPGTTDTRGGAAGTGSTDTGSIAPQPLGVSSLTFEVLTHTQGGRYAPKNIGAIWVETQAGDFVKTLEVWARTRIRYLSRWKRETGSNTVDAITGATLRTHETHTVAWDLTDVGGALVEPGPYKMVVETTDHNGAGDTLDVPFELGEPLTMTAPDTSTYTDITLVVK